jgi:O-antigen ligase
VIVWRTAGRGKATGAVLGVTAASAIAITAVAVFALAPILDRFDPASGGEGRLQAWPAVLSAANNYLPLGSGVGSFDPVYRSLEQVETLKAEFFNHAHNDYLELLLEGGWLAIAVIAVFLFWFGKQVRLAWGTHLGEVGALARASTLVVPALLLHSVVDYPLRTESLAVFFAFACGSVCRPGPTGVRHIGEGAKGSEGVTRIPQLRNSQSKITA